MLTPSVVFYANIFCCVVMFTVVCVFSRWCLTAFCTQHCPKRFIKDLLDTGRATTECPSGKRFVLMTRCPITAILGNHHVQDVSWSPLVGCLQLGKKDFVAWFVTSVWPSERQRPERYKTCFRNPQLNWVWGGCHLICWCIVSLRWLLYSSQVTYNQLFYPYSF